MTIFEAYNSTKKKLEKAGFEIVDMTCLDVKKVQQRAIELAQNDYFVVIVGKSNHPEVIAIKANAEQFSNILSVFIQLPRSYKGTDPNDEQLRNILFIDTTEEVLK